MSDKTIFHTNQVPTKPAKLPPSLPLDTTLELFHDDFIDFASSSSPNKNGLPADQTLDSIQEEVDFDMLIVE